MFYSASILIKGVSKKGESSFWEDKIILLEAGSKDEAFIKAESIGKTFECEYETANNDHIQWKFKQVERVFEIDEDTLINGTELFSRYLRNSEVQSILTPFEDIGT